ncbi:gastric inhibitory polypeptide receptor isoform X3 [Alligator mississippiensis]|uniref:gastric inhibitory polypeptide receptor isoform X3 n=1 Tax=Alligator mississippiensis TaxID=8496 RepID=UPI0028779A41|nr:gastric inhibitory polypeptide receptor isoform X3 [Alligator mississippiensis]
MWLAVALALLWAALMEAGGVERSAADTVVAWREYRQECERRLRDQPPALGLVCNRTFDMYACWDDATPNTTARVPCPWYLPWHHHVRDGSVLRRCGPDGRWVAEPGGPPWHDNAQCEAPAPELPLQHQAWLLERGRLVYTAGYSLSLAALLLALLPLLACRRLRCTRNRIHAQLFGSFVLRAAAVLARDELLRRLLARPPRPPGAPPALPGQAVASCRLAQVLTQYGVGANHCWLLAEGLHLHALLALRGTEDGRLPAYLLLGWGTPVLFVGPWAVVRYLYENTQCWERIDNRAHWWIVRCPLLLAVLVNFVLFVRILRVLGAKLRAPHGRCPDYKLRLARSTLTLVPLLGSHELLFALLPEAPRGALRFARLFLHLFLSSFQGLLVSVLYCFLNKEVQAELRRQWQRCQLGRSLQRARGRGRGCRHGPGCGCGRGPGTPARLRPAGGQEEPAPGAGGPPGAELSESTC